MDIGSRIRSARKTLGWSQERLARRADVSLNLVSKLERGEVKDPHYSTLIGVADALGISLGQLVGEEEHPKAEAPASLPDVSDGGRREEELDAEAPEEPEQEHIDYRKLYFELGERQHEMLHEILANIDEVLTTEDYEEFTKLPVAEQHWRIETAERLNDLAEELLQSMRDEQVAGQRDELAERRQRQSAKIEEFRKSA